MRNSGYKGKIKIFDTIIPLSITVADAPRVGRAVVDYNKGNIGAIAYQEFAKELTR